MNFTISPRRKKSKTLIYGIGINDADYQVDLRLGGLRVRCPYFTTWSNMLKRCYNKKTLMKNSTYDNTNVCFEWLTFSNFKTWMETQNWEGRELDKDLLGDGKLYSPETCVFVDRLTNCFLLDCKKRRGQYKLGVDIYKPNGKFRARCSNPFTNTVEHLGYFFSEDDAHNQWKKRKKELAIQLATLQEDERVADKLINLFKNEVLNGKYD